MNGVYEGLNESRVGRFGRGSKWRCICRVCSLSKGVETKEAVEYREYLCETSTWAACNNLDSDLDVNRECA